MDPITIVGLGAKVIDVLMPYVKKGAEQFTKDVGATACEKVESLARTLKIRLSGDKTTTDVLNKFEDNPEGYKNVIETILQMKLEQDADLATELTKHLNDMGPTLKVIQKMNKGKNVTGVDVGVMTEGSLEVVQEIGKGKNIVGGSSNALGNSFMSKNVQTTIDFSNYLKGRTIDFSGREYHN